MKISQEEASQKRKLYQPRSAYLEFIHIRLPRTTTYHISPTTTTTTNKAIMCFGSSDKEEHWWGYIDDGQGWTARPKSEYMATPAYNSDLRNSEKQSRKAYAKKGIHVPKESKYTKRW